MNKLTENVPTAKDGDILGVAQNTLHKWSDAVTFPPKSNPANTDVKRSDLESF